MGDPKKPKKKYSTPTHPWQKERIEEEKILTREYGLANKKEVWRVTSLVRKFAGQAKKLSAGKSAQTEKEKVDFMKSLQNLGLISSGASIDSVLSLSAKDVMARRLQTIVFKNGLARSVKQARQFIVHGHIYVSGKKITVPSYLVSVGEEAMINFSVKSSLADVDHPERVALIKKEKKRRDTRSDPRGRGRGSRRPRPSNK